LRPSGQARGRPAAGQQISPRPCGVLLSTDKVVVRRWLAGLPHGIIDLIIYNFTEQFMNLTQSILGFSLVLAAGAAAANPQPAGMWDNLVGMKYAKARKEVIDAGWRPDHRNAAAEWERQLQGQFPELRSCEANGQCVHYFVSYDGVCLKVVTEGETVAAFKVRSVQQGCPKQ
jgi:hypothetical protein